MKRIRQTDFSSSYAPLPQYHCNSSKFIKQEVPNPTTYKQEFLLESVPPPPQVLVFPEIQQQGNSSHDQYMITSELPSNFDFLDTNLQISLDSVNANNSYHEQNIDYISPLLFNYPNEGTSTSMYQQTSLERASFERARAEIDEILSPSTASTTQSSALFTTNSSPVLDDSLLQYNFIPSCDDNLSNNTLSSSVVTQETKTTEEYQPNTLRGYFRRTTSSTQCHICGKTYTESSNLSKHIRTVHLKLRPFKCHLCLSKFAEKNKLRKHIQSVHEHARPYKCELCSATFSQASDRKRHRMVLHEGRRPFSCEKCGKSFGRRSSLTQHRYRIHKETQEKTQLPEKSINPTVSLEHMSVPTVLFTPQAHNQTGNELNC